MQGTTVPISLADILIYTGLPVALLIILTALALLIREWRDTPTVPDPNLEHLYCLLYTSPSPRD